MPHLNRSFPRRGFTLIELLIVIGIIACLIGLLLPTISRARQYSLQVNCASNLHQIGLGLEAYSQTYRHLPDVPTPAGLREAMNEVQIGQSKVMVCPADTSGAIGYNMTASFAGMPRTVGEPTAVLAMETAPRHQGRSNALYFDGRVELQ